MPYLAFVLFQVPLALTITQILAIDLGTDMLPAWRSPQNALRPA